VFTAEAITLFYAWKTSNILEEFRDSSSIAYACYAQIQAWGIGVPMILLIGHTSVDATYFARVFLIWIFSVSSVLVVVYPKIFKAIRRRRNPDFNASSRSRVGNVASVYNPNGSNNMSGLSSFNENQRRQHRISFNSAMLKELNGSNLSSVSFQESKKSGYFTSIDDLVGTQATSGNSDMKSVGTSSSSESVYTNDA